MIQHTTIYDTRNDLNNLIDGHIENRSVKDLLENYLPFCYLTIVNNRVNH